MTKDAQKSQTIDRREFDRRVDLGEDPFAVARALRPIQLSSKSRRIGSFPAITGIVLAVFAVALSAYLLWQLIGLQNRAVSLAAKVEDLTQRVDAFFATTTPPPPGTLTPNKIELRTTDLNVILGEPEKELIFVILSGVQSVADYPVTAEIVSGPGQIEPKRANTEKDGTIKIRYQPGKTASGGGTVTIRITAGSSLTDDFRLTLSQPPPAGITFIPDPEKQNPTTVDWGGTFSLYFQLSGNTPTPARNLSVGCTTDQEQFVTVKVSGQNPLSWSELGQGKTAEVTIELETTSSKPATDISVNITCVAQAENGEGPISQSVSVQVRVPSVLVARLTFDPAKIDLAQVRESVAIMVTAFDANDQPIAGQTIALTASSGLVTPAQVISGQDGRASFNYWPGEPRQAATIIAASGDVTGLLKLLLTEIVLDPSAFDLGMGMSATATVSLRADRVPITNTAVTLRAQPEGFVTFGGKRTYEAKTDSNHGKLTVTLTGAKVGSGNLIAGVKDGVPTKASITVRPVAWNKVEPNAKLYKNPIKSEAEYVRDALLDEKFPIHGISSDKVWYQVRTPEKGMAWTPANNVALIGSLAGVPPVEWKKPTSQPAPTAPTMPTPGAYIVKVSTGQETAPLYRIGGSTVQADQLAQVKENGEIVVLDSDSVQEANPPQGYVLIRAVVWLPSDLVTETANSTSDYVIKEHDDSYEICWSITMGGGIVGKNGCGVLFPYSRQYPAENKILDQIESWVKISILAWLPYENVGAASP